MYNNHSNYPNNLDYQNYNDINYYNPNNQDNFSRSIEIERLIYEFQENRRRINNLLKRITRLENYLRIKDEEENF